MSEVLASALKPNRNRWRAGRALATLVVFGLTTACGSDTSAAESQLPTVRTTVTAAAPSPVPAAKRASHAPVMADCQADHPENWHGVPDNLRSDLIAPLIGARPYEVATGTLVTAACKKGVSRRAVEGGGAVVTIDHIPPGFGLAESEICLMFMPKLDTSTATLVYDGAGVCPSSGA